LSKKLFLFLKLEAIELDSPLDKKLFLCNNML